ncbi:MAG: antibiotic biosynthesis monooxygenase family protein [Alphaproteobacteria bacterium]
MHARISWGKIQPGQWDAFEAAFKDVVGKAGPQPGLKGRYLFRDTNDPDAGFTLSLWDSESHMTEYEASGTMKDNVLPAIERFFTGEYTTTHVEACYSENDG